jgi:hypothetical protein
MEGESKVFSSSDGNLVLTNRRVRNRTTELGSEKLESITLDAISYCGLVQKSYPVLLILAFGVALAGFVAIQMEFELSGVFFVAAGLLAILFAISRHSVITVSSTGEESIEVLARGISSSSIKRFLDMIDAEKHKYLSRLS